MKAIGDTLPRRFKAKASGAITAGKPLIVETDGDVAQVAETSIAAATGTQANAANVNSEDTAVIFDSATDKFTLCYADRNNGDYGTYVVGTISGTSITFGTPAVFNSAAVTNVDAVYDEASGNIVILWAQASTGGRAIVGSRSGDTITFGSAVTFDANSTFGVHGAYIEDASKVLVVNWRNSAGTGAGIVGTVSGTSISFGSATELPDSVSPRGISTASVGSSKAVVAFRDNDASPTAGKAVVATISGTSVSFGSVATFETQGYSGTGYQVDVAYDSANDKAVIGYVDGGNNSYGTAIVGTVSGTSISFGSAVVFASDNISGNFTPVLEYSTKSGKIFIVYADASDSEKGKYIRGTVSGTSISFADGATFTTDQIAWLSLAVEDTNNKFAVGYQDSSAGGDPSAQIIQDAYDQTNLTAENYIGIAEHAAADTETATVLIKGGVSTTQSSLTPGQTYFVQGDGTLGLTADSPSVTAGTAVTSTKLIVKG